MKEEDNSFLNTLGGYSDPISKLDDGDKVTLADDALEDLFKFEEEIPEEGQVSANEVKQPKKETPAKTQQTQTLPNEEKSNNNESEYISDMFEAIAEQYGWEIEDDKKPSSIEDFMSYIQDVVEENSKPDYASEQVAQLDEFVKNGGKISDFLEVTQPLDFDAVDLNNEQTQRDVVKAYLKTQGLSKERITKKIEKYETAGILEDEAEEALDSLKEYTEKQQKVLVENQRRAKAQQEAAQQEYVSSVVKEIETLSDVRGVTIPLKAKKEALDYLLKPTKTGYTQFAIDLNQDTKRLVEVALFMKNPQMFSETMKKAGESAAVKRLRDKLHTRSTTAARTKQIDDAKRSSLIDLF
jgi:hypothetical protein